MPLFVLMSDNNNNKGTMDWISAGVTAASLLGNLVGTGMTNKRMRAAQRRQYEYSVKLMDKQQEFNKEAFNMENAYNTPLAQRERMEQAGLNPNFVDSPAIAQMESASTANGPAGQVQPYDFSQLANMYATIQSVKRENELAKSQKDLNATAAEVNRTQADLNEANASKAFSDIQYQKEVATPLAQSQKKYYDESFEDLKSQITNREQATSINAKQVDAYAKSIEQAIKESDANIENMQTLTDFARQRLPKELAKLDAETTDLLVRAACAKVLANNDSMRVKIEQQNANSNSFNSLINSRRLQEDIRHNKKTEHIASTLNKSVIDVNNATSEKINAETGKIKAETYYQELYNYISYTYDGEMKNAALWLLIAQKDEIIAKSEFTKEQCEQLTDSYFGNMLRAYTSWIPGF